jgi:hypothetical protein
MLAFRSLSGACQFFHELPHLALGLNGRTVRTSPSGSGLADTLDEVRAIMNAWLWVANPLEKWTEVPGSDLTRFDHLDQYLGLNGGIRYVYWATPAFRRQIRIDDAAYIWLSPSGGVIAAGTVAEEPNENEFDHPARLRAPGWNEEEATSGWKTGINIEHVWGCRSPLRVVANLFTYGSADNANTIFRLDEAQQRSIIRAIEEREGAA